MVSKSQLLIVSPFEYILACLCVLCGVISDFVTYGAVPRPNALCPNCGALERHRIAALYFKTIDLSGRILEVGPCQNGLSKYLSSFNYQSLDKDKEFTTYKMDVQNITIDGVFDLIYVSHVLEYVENDILAVSELAKILNKNGKIVIQEAIFGIPEDTL